MHAETNEHHLHSYVLLFLCLYKMLHCALVEMRFLVLARDDGVAGTCAVVLWMFTLQRRCKSEFCQRENQGFAMETSIPSISLL